MTTKSNKKEIKIRTICKKDLPTLAKVFMDAYKPENTGEYWTVKTSLEVVKYWHDRSPKNLQILAEIEDKVIGAFFVDVKPWWDGYRMIDGEFFVLTEYQKLGAGKKILKELVNIAQDKYKCNCFETITFTPENKHPLKWYKRLGFEIDESLVVINADLTKLKTNLD